MKIRNFIIITLLTLFPIFNCQAELEDGLVLYFPFNGNAEDNSNFNNRGIAIGGATLTTDRFGRDNKAFHFDGRNDYIEVYNDLSLILTKQISISLWINLEEVFGNPSVIEKTQGGFGRYGIWVTEESIEFCIRPPDSGLQCTFSDKHAIAQNWYHIVGTYDGNVLELTVNGSVEDRLVFPSTITTSNETLKIGADPFGDRTFIFGTIDDIRLYNRAINRSEILSLYGGSPTSKCSIEYINRATFKDGILNIPYIDILNPSKGEILGTFEAQLQHETKSASISVFLIDATEKAPCPALNPRRITYQNGKVNIPYVDVLNSATGAATSTYEVDMQLEPGSNPLFFSVTGANQK